MNQLHQRILITVAIACILGGAVAKRLPIGGGGSTPSDQVTEAWADGAPKLLIVENTEQRGVNTGIAINSGVWRDPFYAAKGKIVHFDPTDDKGESTDIKGKYPWFDKAMNRVRTDLLPYYVFAYKGKISVGQIKDTPQGVSDFEAKIVKLLQTK